MSKPSFCCQENHFFFPPQRHPDFHFSPGSNGIPIRRVVSVLSSVALLGTSWCLWPFLGATSFDWQRYSARLPFRDLAFAQNRTLAIFPLDVPFQRMLQLRTFWNGLLDWVVSKMRSVLQGGNLGVSKAILYPTIAIFIQNITKNNFRWFSLKKSQKPTQKYGKVSDLQQKPKDTLSAWQADDQIGWHRAVLNTLIRQGRCC